MALQVPASSDGGDPVTVPEAKKQARVDASLTFDDDYIEGLITIARQYVEYVNQRSFLNTTWIETFDRFPDEFFRPQRSPLVSVSSIQYVDTDGDTQTWTASEYRLDTSTEPGRIGLAWGESFPSIRAVTNAVTLAYIAGYGTTNASVPSVYRMAIKWLVAQLYENRESEVTGTIVQSFDTQWKSLAGVRRIRVA